jgi:single-stranded-DNA-specific exonuclease
VALKSGTRHWIEPHPQSVPALFRTAIGGHPLVAQLLLSRQIADPQAARAFLDPQHYIPCPPGQLPEMEKALERLSRAIQQGELICVWGDFDVDGQTATTILVSTLQELGAKVAYHIPVRSSESHGIGVPVLNRYLERGASLVLTCDTGIGAHEAIDAARTRGADVIVTDHHDPPPTLPDASAIVNPKLLAPGHPLQTLPGVGVAYELAAALYDHFRRYGDAEQYLDLLSLGLVADLAELTKDTRYLLQRGLGALRETDRLGLQMMMDLAGTSPSSVTEEQIGFLLGPRLNALGRLDDANPVVDFLTTTDPDRARAFALCLEALNAERKLLTDQVFQGAIAQIEREQSLLDQAALVLSHPAWPGGVIGIVASRLVDRYHKPAILFSAPPGEIARGSARSIEGCNITAAIAEQKKMLAEFGGHPMAAGLAIAPERIPEFRRSLSRSIRQQIGDGERADTLQIDAYIDFDELSLDLVTDLERLAPFGPANPPVVLASRDLTLKSYGALGRTSEHLQLIVCDQKQQTRRVIWWQGAGWPLPQGKFDLAYSARVSVFKGERSVQLEWIDARSVEEFIAVTDPAPSLTIVDYRRELNPMLMLKQLQAQGDIAIWCEGAIRKQIGGLYRHEMKHANGLAIWTIPPGETELRAVVKAVSPQVVYLFGISPELDAHESFLKRLAGLVKFVLNSKDGQASVAGLAGATAQRETTVRMGLVWLAKVGQVAMVGETGDVVQLAKGSGQEEDGMAQVADELKFLLAETAAYRKYYASAEKDRLLN